MTRIAIFASGGGSNAKAIIRHFQDHNSISVALVISNRTSAGVHNVAQSYSIPSLTLSNADFEREDYLIPLLQEHRIDFIALAGFLRLIPSSITQAFPKRIINIHPSLLPKYGGKGMYGLHVHKAVKANHEDLTGLTIHYVNEEFDKGEIIFQAETQVLATDAPEDIAARVLKLEHYHYPRVIEKLLLGL